ncbi:MAG TPA: PIN domain-containing protein [Candidimonas sp.]|nr:PIN domain-containing protein [Spongiibacteraceae bacterium]HUH59276.1 PIN domain-containing protein [Candidimonas sp.]
MDRLSQPQAARLLQASSDTPSIPQVLVLDTCVLLSNVLRQLFLRLAALACFSPAWSPVIGDEWRRNAARLWKVSEEEIDAQWLALQEAFPEADQGDVTVYKAGLHRSDPKDWHVIAAARAVRARDAAVRVGVVTRNMKDFNRSELRGLGLDLYDPDDLLVRCWRQYPTSASDAFQAIPEYARAPGNETEALEVILKRERLFRLNRLYAESP